MVKGKKYFKLLKGRIVIALLALFTCSTVVMVINHLTYSTLWDYSQWSRFSSNGIVLSDRLNVYLTKIIMEKNPTSKQRYAHKIKKTVSEFDLFLTQIIEGDLGGGISKVDDPSIVKNLANVKHIWSIQIKPMVELLADITLQGSLSNQDLEEFRTVFDFAESFSERIKENTLAGQETVREQMQFLKNLQYAVSGLFLLVIGFILLLGRDVGDRLMQLSETAMKIAGGDLATRFQVKRDDEIGMVSGSINQMVDNIASEVKIRKKAEDAVLTKSRFLATMSHEIRTPMNAVLSCANLLLDEISKQEHVKLLKTILNSGDTLLALINDILDFSKIEAGKMELENEPFDFHNNLKEIIDLLKAQAKAKGINLVYEVDESVPNWVVGDVTRFRQVLVNLISNGIKFTKDMVLVNVSAQSTEGQSLELLTEVTDNGIGMSEEARKSLFQDFKQVDASTTRKFGGTGLGLAICKGITKVMGGKIWIDSVPGQGSTFSFTMRTRTASVGKSKRTVKLSDINPQMAAEHPLKILMAEDNSINQMVAKKMLAKLGYRIDVAGNGQEAVSAVKKQDYDIILMDQHMPEMDGLEATKEIRKLKTIVQPKIFALTASAFKEDKDRCMNAGMDGFLTKPIVISQIVAAFLECDANKGLEERQENINYVDFDDLVRQFSGDVELWGEIIEQYLTTAPHFIEDIKRAILKEDFKTIETTAHTLKSIVANFQADAVVEVALKLEFAGKKENLNYAKIIAEDLEIKINRLSKELKWGLQQKAA